MRLYYVRHGEPIYEPDSLTKLGEAQAKALVSRLGEIKFDKVFVSSSKRAILTAIPTCEKQNIEYEILDWCNEKYAGEEFMDYDSHGKRYFMKDCDNYKKLFVSREIEDMGFSWYEHPAFKDKKCKSGIKRIAAKSDEFFANLGYTHDTEKHCFITKKPVFENVAIFAHAGFGSVFLSHILDIPYPIFCTRFTMCHSGITVIDFEDIDGIVIPKILTYSNDSHIKMAGLQAKWPFNIEI